MNELPEGCHGETPKVVAWVGMPEDQNERWTAGDAVVLAETVRDWKWGRPDVLIVAGPNDGDGDLIVVASGLDPDEKDKLAEAWLGWIEDGSPSEWWNQNSEWVWFLASGYTEQ
jgi:hypothetical protein